MSSFKRCAHSNAAFTLIELLVVIAIIAILSVVVILVLNPAQLLQQARDSNRISDMSTLNTALGVYQAQGGSSLGSANTIYLSVADPSATSTLGDQCQGLGFNPAPNGYSYSCAASSTYRTTSGQGWIPINFSSLPAGSPLGQLPQDPINTTTSREYYTYTTNGSQYEETSVPESSKYQIGGSNDVISNDGGRLASVYEKGSALGLEPLDYGDPTLVGLWSFNEGTGTIAYDYSGNNATGSWSGTQTGTSGYYSAGKIGSWAGTFDGTSTYILTNRTLSSLLSATDGTLSVWIYAVGTAPVVSNSFNGDAIIADQIAGGGYLGLLRANIGGLDDIWAYNYPGGETRIGVTSTIGQWMQVFWVHTGGNLYLYANGALVGSVNSGNTQILANKIIIGGDSNPSLPHYFSGLIDDVRIYNRALSAAQIAAMYTGGK